MTSFGSIRLCSHLNSIVDTPKLLRPISRWSSSYAGLDKASQLAKLAACEKYGLKFLASPCRKTPVWSGKVGSPLCADNVSTISVSSPALWGWKVTDEPPAVSLGDASNPAKRPGLNFSTLATWNRRVALERPDKLRFVNLLQNYAGPEYWGVPTYAEYLQRYIRIVKPQLLSFDHYPRFYDDDDDTSLNPNITKAGFRRQLGVMRATAQAKIPFWSIIRCIGIDLVASRQSIRCDRSRLRCLVPALAYGTAGLLHSICLNQRTSFHTCSAEIYNDYDYVSECTD